MNDKIVSPKNDLMFKMLFAGDKELTKSLIASLMHIKLEDIKNLKFLNNEIAPLRHDNKLSRLDLSVMVDKQLINIEVQVRQDKYYVERTMFYWSKLFTTHLKRGEDYNKLPRTVMLNILDFN